MFTKLQVSLISLLFIFMAGSCENVKFMLFLTFVCLRFHSNFTGEAINTYHIKGKNGIGWTYIL